MGAAPEHYEPVLEVTDYFDGPRAGIAHFRGAPHRFQSRLLDATEYRGDFESVDIFELSPVNQTGATVPILAHAVFRVANDKSSSFPRQLEVQWQIIEQS